LRPDQPTVLLLHRCRAASSLTRRRNSNIRRLNSTRSSRYPPRERLSKATLYGSIRRRGFVSGRWFCRRSRVRLAESDLSFALCHPATSSRARSRSLSSSPHSYATNPGVSVNLLCLVTSSPYAAQSRSSSSGVLVRGGSNPSFLNSICLLSLPIRAFFSVPFRWMTQYVSDKGSKLEVPVQTGRLLISFQEPW
jgi:hypothetical protein